MKRLIGIVIIILFIMLGAITLIGADKTFSETENRHLKQIPQASLSSLLDGSFMSDFEDYLADQIAGKDFFLTFKTKSEQALLKRENNGVVKAGHYLVEPFIYDELNVMKNIEALNQFNQSSIDLTVMLVPNQVGVYQDYLPEHLPTDDQFDVLNRIEDAFEVETVNVADVLRGHDQENIYYYTDHHWTMRGAYLAYETWFKDRAKPLSDYKNEVISSSFRGTRYRTYHDFTLPTDSIEWFRVTDELDLTITYSDGTETDQYFNHQFLSETDQYRFFLDGNDPLIKIQIDHETPRDRQLVILKDSYADSLVPFLLEHYDEIHLIDPRYNKQSLKTYMSDHELEELFVLYNLHTFNEDQALRQILY